MATQRRRLAVSGTQHLGTAAEEAMRARRGNPWRPTLSDSVVTLYRETEDGEIEVSVTVNVEREGRELRCSVERQAVGPGGLVVLLTDAEMELAEVEATDREREALDEGDE